MDRSTKYPDSYTDAEHDKALGRLAADIAKGWRTPGPWMYSIRGQTIEIRGEVEPHPMGDARGLVAHTGFHAIHNNGRSRPSDRQLADAAFIVRACNAHDDLLAACKAVLARLDLEPEGAIFPCSAQREVLRAAIRKAGGAL